MSLSQQVLEQSKNLEMKAATLDAIASPFWLIGWLVGIIWRGIGYMIAAVVVGFKAGANNDNEQQE